ETEPPQKNLSDDGKEAEATDPLDECGDCRERRRHLQDQEIGVRAEAEGRRNVARARAERGDPDRACERERRRALAKRPKEKRGGESRRGAKAGRRRSF